MKGVQVGSRAVMPYFNGFAMGVFAAAVVTVLSGSILTSASAAADPAKPAAVATHQTGVADLRYARAVSWISTSHVSR